MIILYLTQLKILRGQVNDNPIFDTILIEEVVCEQLYLSRG